MNLENNLEHFIWLTQQQDFWLLSLTAQPNGRCTEVLVEGKANQVLITWLANIFNLRQKQVAIISGESSRQKRVALPLTIGEASDIISMFISKISS
jgi:Uncharacterised ACR, YggU family COG1872